MPCDLVQSRLCMVGFASGVLVCFSGLLYSHLTLSLKKAESVVLAASMVGSDVFSQPSNVFLERSELETKLASSFAGRIEVFRAILPPGRQWTAFRAHGNCKHLQDLCPTDGRKEDPSLLLGQRNPRRPISALLHIHIPTRAPFQRLSPTRSVAWN